MGIKDFFIGLISKQSNLSSKRFLGYMSFFFLVLDFTAVRVFKLDIHPAITDTLQQLVMAALLVTTIDHFGPKPNQPENNG